MRFLFFDKVLRIEKGKSIEGVKSFSLSEEFLNGHFGKIAIVPGMICIESMAQLLGWLITCSCDFRCSAMMSLIEDVTVSPYLTPGFTANIHAEIISVSKTDSLGKASMDVDGTRIARLDRIVYSHMNLADPRKLRKMFLYYSGLTETELSAFETSQGSESTFASGKSVPKTGKEACRYGDQED